MTQLTVLQEVMSRNPFNYFLEEKASYTQAELQGVLLLYDWHTSAMREDLVAAGYSETEAQSYVKTYSQYNSQNTLNADLKTALSLRASGAMAMSEHVSDLCNALTKKYFTGIAKSAITNSIISDIDVSSLLSGESSLFGMLGNFLGGLPNTDDPTTADGDPLVTASGDFGGTLTDPIVLDLDGDGVTLTSIDDSNAYFDLYGNDYAVHTGWIGSGDGFLVTDTNGNGVIDDISELFGDSETDGFTALSALDSNGDGVINSSDDDFSSLQVWVDADSDGVTDDGELYSLADLGITEFSLNSEEVDETSGDNTIGSLAVMDAVLKNRDIGFRI